MARQRISPSSSEATPRRTSSRGRPRHFDYATFRALAPLIAVAVAEGRFAPDWMHPVLRLVLVLDHIGKRSLGSGWLNNLVFESADLPLGITRTAGKTHPRLVELLHQATAPVSLPWLLDLGAAHRPQLTPAQRVCWAVSAATGLFEDDPQDLESYLKDGPKITLCLRMPQAQADRSNWARLLRFLGPSADEEWLRGGPPTPPAFLAALRPPVRLSELASPPPNVPLAGLHDHLRKEWPRLARHTPKQAADAIAAFADAAMPFQASPPEPDAEFGWAVSDLFFERLDVSGLRTGHAEKWVRLRADAVCVGPVIRSRTQKRVFSIDSDEDGASADQA